MYHKVIELSLYQPESVCTTAAARETRAPLRSRAAELRRNVLAAVELLVTAAIGLCVLFCVGLTVSML